MIEVYFAATLLAQVPTASDAIGEAFADLDRRYFSMLISTAEALTATLAESPREGASASRCLGLLTPLHVDLDTKRLRREMRLFSTVTPEARSDVFELARATARTQAANILIRRRILEGAEGDCMTVPAYRVQKMRTLEISDDVQDLMNLVVNQPLTGSPLVD